MAYMIITATPNLPSTTPNPFKGALHIPFQGSLNPLGSKWPCYDREPRLLDRRQPKPRFAKGLPGAWLAIFQSYVPPGCVDQVSQGHNSSLLIGVMKGFCESMGCLLKGY